MPTARTRWRAHGAVLLAVLVSSACETRAPMPPAGPWQPAETHRGVLESSGARLSYQLDLPSRRGDVAAVVIGHGSGHVRKEQCGRLAAGFLERGFAVLCYDKRGVGGSSGEYASVGTGNSDRMFDVLAADMSAGVRFLRSRPGIDVERIGLAGPSQAGWIIPLAAARARAAFMIILSGPAVSVGEEIFYSALVEQTTRPLAEADRELAAFAGVRGFDPRSQLEALDVPGLWLLGDHDRSIPIPATVAVLDELASRGKPFTRVVFAGAGHDLGGAPIWDEIDRWLRLLDDRYAAEDRTQSDRGARPRPAPADLT